MAYELTSQFVIYGARERRSPAVDPLVGHIDSFIDEQHELRSSKTEYPLEFGATISDHLVTLPHRLQLTGFVSDLLVPDRARSRDHTTRGEEAWQRIIDLQRDRTLITCTTTLGEYHNMVIMRAVAEVNDRYSRALRFTMELEEMQIRRIGTVPEGYYNAGTEEQVPLVEADDPNVQLITVWEDIPPDERIADALAEYDIEVSTDARSAVGVRTERRRTTSGDQAVVLVPRSGIWGSVASWAARAVDIADSVVHHFHGQHQTEPEAEDVEEEGA